MGLLSSIRKQVRDTAENPSTPLSADDHWLLDVLGGQSESGVQVNRVSAMGFAPVWRAVNLLSSDVGKLPCLLYRKLEDGSRERETNNPLYERIRRKPHPDMTAGHFKKICTSQVLLVGNSYSYIGNNRELTILEPSWVTPVKMDGKLWYHYQPDRADPVVFDASRILHLKGLGWDGLQGYSVLEFGRNTIGEGVAFRSYGSKFFSNSARPSTVLEYPGHLKPGQAKQILEAWERMCQGLDNTHRTAVLQRGMVAKPLTISARDAQLIDSRRLNVRDIANLFGVNPSKLGDRESVSYNSLEQENLAYLSEGLDPLLCMWEEELIDKLLTPQQRNKGLFFEFVREALIRTDISTEIDTLVKEVNNGLLSIDEARAIKNRAKLPDGIGEAFRVPTNIAEIGQEEEQEEQAEPTSFDFEESFKVASEALEKLVEATYQRMAKRLHKAKDKSVEKHLAPLVEQLEPVLRLAAPMLEAEQEAKKIIKLAQAEEDCFGKIMEASRDVQRTSICN